MKIGLTNNQLKILAMVAMTLDHIGVVLFPHVLWLRILGRLAFPIYAYMIAEGCRHSRKPLRYLTSLALMAAVCQLTYFFAMGSLYMCIMVTFSLSVGLILLVKNARVKKGVFPWLLVIAGLVTAFFLCEVLPLLLPGTDYAVDYGFLGVLIPVFVYLGKDNITRVLLCATGLIGLTFGSNMIQWFSLLALPLLALYNGQRGKWNMKWFFYLFYPAHLVAIQAVAWFL